MLKARFCRDDRPQLHAIELNPAYVDVAVKRWQDFTGQPAVLEDDGRSFAEIATARAGAATWATAVKE